MFSKIIVRKYAITVLICAIGIGLLIDIMIYGESMALYIARDDCKACKEFESRIDLNGYLGRVFVGGES